MSIASKKKKKLFCGILCFTLIFTAVFSPVFAASSESEQVILGGMLMGVKMQTKGIAVVKIGSVETASGTCSPAYDAGIKVCDIIIKMNGKTVTSAKQVVDSITECDGKSVTVTVERNGELIDFILYPKIAVDGSYRAGIWIRDSAAGIGTVTYINEKTNEFAGLGHGICDGDTASLLPLSRGIVTEVELTGIEKGQSGAPGEIKGAFKGGKIGALVKNTKQGVYGIYSSLPLGAKQKIQVAKFGEISEGEAFIRCTVSNTTNNYKIEIKKINKNPNGKNFTINVTDDALLSLTGGIIQGMSGSPIIQNGKLIGAVTHVTVNNPTKGYGIFIGNML